MRLYRKAKLNAGAAGGAGGGLRRLGELNYYYHGSKSAQHNLNKNLLNDLIQYDLLVAVESQIIYCADNNFKTFQQMESSVVLSSEDGQRRSGRITVGGKLFQIRTAARTCMSDGGIYTYATSEWK